MENNLHQPTTQLPTVRIHLRTTSPSRHPHHCACVTGAPWRARRARGPRSRPLSGEQGAARHGGHAHVVGRAGVRGVPRLRAGPAPRLRTGGAGRIPRRWRRRAQDDEVSVPAARRRPAAREAQAGALRLPQGAAAGAQAARAGHSGPPLPCERRAARVCLVGVSGYAPRRAVRLRAPLVSLPLLSEPLISPGCLLGSVGSSVLSAFHSWPLFFHFWCVAWLGRATPKSQVLFFFNS